MYLMFGISARVFGNLLGLDILVFIECLYISFIVSLVYIFSRLPYHAILTYLYTASRIAATDSAQGPFC